MMHTRMSWGLLPLLVVALTVCAAPATEQNDYSNPEHDADQQPAESLLGEAAHGAARRPHLGVPRPAPTPPRAETTSGLSTDAGAMAVWTPTSIPSCTTTQTGT